jgi:acyl dehydratase
MVRQMFYEDVNENHEIPVLIKHPTTQQLVKWAGASGDYYEIHYDKDYALANGLPGVIVHGWLVLSFLAQMVTDWMGTNGELVKLGCEYRSMLVPGEDVICKGKVTGKYVRNGKNYIEAEIWAGNFTEVAAVYGSVTITLPSCAYSSR